MSEVISVDQFQRGSFAKKLNLPLDSSWDQIFSVSDENRRRELCHEHNLSLNTAWPHIRLAMLRQYREENPSEFTEEKKLEFASKHNLPSDLDWDSLQFIAIEQQIEENHKAYREHLG